MKTNDLYSIRQMGFTLVEVIITLLMSAILGTILVQLGGTALTKSGSTVITVMDEVAGQKLMEEVVADYVREINTDPDNALNSTMNNNYGTGNQVVKQYVTFTGGVISPQGTPGNTLMVTVSSGGHKLTTLFAKTRTASSNDPKEKY
ncbi:type II secretion system protein [Desulfobacula phenolica]|uniref:Prepilin-type N-terminal cleavage/methylation domain-containing protein n=1 Tax=Desulfobacula phenolica TaxID=90732 RepID=A0A1H2FSL7_9BACT|nr:type II secretion system protein [Desulfobacula phenolica]SDU10333.1 prepilin-type N-terminal cleavage/methylation domain-containing protein [Desulfobacula phenolica]